MPRVAIAENQVAPARTTDERFRAANVPGGGLGDGLQRIGAAIGDTADTFALFDQNAVKHLDNTAYARVGEVVTPYLLTEGMATAEATPKLQESLQKIRTDMMAAAKNDRQRTMFSRAFDARMVDLTPRLMMHAGQQEKVWHDKESLGRQMNMASEAVSTALDPDLTAFNNAVATGKTEIESRFGKGSEQTRLEQARYVSGIQSSVVKKLMVGDPVAAGAYMATHAADILPNDATELTAALHGPLMERRGEADLDALIHTDTGALDYVRPANAPQPAKGSIVAITAFAESRNRDYGKDGQPIVSPKGARFGMQVMPDTARKPGYGISPAADESPAEYNRVGRQLLGKFNELYRDPAKAWAAYNWSKGGVDRLVAKYGDAWLSHAPDETQKYVRSNVAMLGRAGVPQDTYAPRRDDLVGLYAKIDAQDWDFERKKSARMALDRRVAIDDRLRARTQQDAQDQAFAYVANLPGGEASFTSVNMLPPDIRRDLSPEAQLSFQQRATQNAKPVEIKPYGETAIKLTRLSIERPEDFKRIDLRQYQPQLSPSEYAGFVEDQSKAKNAPPGAFNLRSEIDATIRSRGADIGIGDLTDIDSKTGLRKAPDQYMAVAASMRAYLTRATEGKRQPTDDEMAKAFNYATQKAIVGGQVQIDGRDARVYDRKGPIGVSVSVPPAVAARIRANFKANGRPSPTADEIQHWYLINQGRPGFWD